MEVVAAVWRFFNAPRASSNKRAGGDTFRDNQPFVVPRVHQIVPRPLIVPVEISLGQRQLEQAGRFDQLRVFGDKHVVVAGRNTDADFRIDLERREAVFQSAQQRQLLRRVARPRVRALKPRIYPGSTKPAATTTGFASSAHAAPSENIRGGSSPASGPALATTVAALLLAPYYGDRRVGVHFIVKRVGIVHLDDYIHRVCRGHQLP